MEPTSPHFCTHDMFHKEMLDDRFDVMNEQRFDTKRRSVLKFGSRPSLRRQAQATPDVPPNSPIEDQTRIGGIWQDYDKRPVSLSSVHDGIISAHGSETPPEFLDENGTITHSSTASCVENTSQTASARRERRDPVSNFVAGSPYSSEGPSPASNHDLSSSHSGDRYTTPASIVDNTPFLPPSSAIVMPSPSASILSEPYAKGRETRQIDIFDRGDYTTTRTTIRPVRPRSPLPCFTPPSSPRLRPSCPRISSRASSPIRPRSPLQSLNCLSSTNFFEHDIDMMLLREAAVLPPIQVAIAQDSIMEGEELWRAPLQQFLYSPEAMRRRRVCSQPQRPQYAFGIS
jgi:hypothetical protein